MSTFTLASTGDSLGPFIYFLIAGLFVGGLAYGASKLLAVWQVQQFKGRRLRVLEGAPLGKDRAVFLVAVGKQVLVLGSSSTGVNLISTVDDPELAAELVGHQAAPPLVQDTVGALLESADERIRKSLIRMQELVAKWSGRSDA